MKEISVLLPTPAYSRLAGPLSYLHTEALSAGTLVRVPLGQREQLGLVWFAPSPERVHPMTEKPQALRPVTEVLDGLQPLSTQWLDLVAFAARYYQRALGEFAIAALPPQLRELNHAQLARQLKKRGAAANAPAGP
ncbi:MAG: primosomal protein N', partial [Betaproteobacteria bacterium]|nr:primosomal protein N' [Betaproteobacteria bacterium]